MDAIGYVFMIAFIAFFLFAIIRYIIYLFGKIRDKKNKK